MNSNLMKWRLWRHRAEEGVRELGILLIAFAPLDFVFADSPDLAGAALLFFAVGAILFVLAVESEARRDTNA